VRGLSVAGLAAGSTVRAAVDPEAEPGPLDHRAEDGTRLDELAQARDRVEPRVERRLAILEEVRDDDAGP